MFQFGVLALHFLNPIFPQAHLPVGAARWHVRAIHSFAVDCYIVLEQFWGRAVRRTSHDSMSLGRFRFAAK
jgi:hypothetical protein